MIQIGDLYARRRLEQSFHGYDPSVLKSGIQKYARRGEVEKGLWCLVEMDLFGLLEWDSPALETYLIKHETEDRAKTQMEARKIRSNMVNRLIVMMSEEINISAWWMPLTIFDLYQKWDASRDDISSRKYLVDMYMYLTSQEMIRLISDIKSVFLLPPDYVKPDKMNDLRKIHSHIQNDYPQIYQNQDEIGEMDWEIDLTKFPDKIAPCIDGLVYNLEKGSDNAFFWIGRLSRLAKEDGGSQYKYARFVWDILFSFIDHHEDFQFLVPTIELLKKFYSQMTHREKPIYLYHAILLLARRREIDWSSETPQIDTPREAVLRLYENHLKNTKMEMDDYIFDIHTKLAKRTDNNLERFALEGAYVKNENKKFLNPDYREIYISLKQQLDLYHSRGCKLDEDWQGVEDLASRTKVEIRDLSSEVMDKLRTSPQAQRRTARYKKAVYILNNLIFKGPYKDGDHSLMNNLRHTYALEFLEDLLELEEKKRSTLKWEYIGYDGNGQYYLVNQNVGNWADKCTDRVTTKIETGVKVVQRGTMVSRVSEIEGTNGLTDDIKEACLQHLYLRFLLDIGDSGTHNILVRKDRDKSDRLVAGIDLEEKRKIAVKTGPLNYLFNKLSKRQAILYQPHLGKIELLKYSQINQNIRSELDAIGIDLERLKGNIELWESLTMSERRKSVVKKKSDRKEHKTKTMLFRNVPEPLWTEIDRFCRQNRITRRRFLALAFDALNKGESSDGDASSLLETEHAIETIERRLKLHKKTEQLCIAIREKKQSAQGALFDGVLRERTLAALRDMEEALLKYMDSILPRAHHQEVATTETGSGPGDKTFEERYQEAQEEFDEMFGGDLESDLRKLDEGKQESEQEEGDKITVQESDTEADPFLFGDEEDISEQIEKVIGGSEAEQDPTNTVSESTEDSGPMLLVDDVTPERKAKVERAKKKMQQMAKSGR